ncbi:MAG TPA: Asp-tRNA(Asn)/Glu-tRNA(Gln) amidotransferase subunit GatB [Candidatus Limnocylindrales bacterium]|nr:Asp-tRNA(Asn)/Glu-tRNA(Gln) amidotransferase subunit GatB [Candidatus Limnocylindrales bacterium]
MSPRSYYEDGGFEAVLGLEVHCQLATASKLFCGCSAAFGGSPNEHTCPVCLGMPGVLPVLNRRAVEYAIAAALATDSTINRTSRWARKNYFYPDLPKAYQITQYEQPYCEHGRVTFEIDGQQKTVRLTRIHMEEDAGKNVHDAHAAWSLVDLNRAGVPLLEIVSEPDIRSGAEAAAYMRKMRSIVRYLGISDGNMNEGSMRCDANVSLRRRGEEKLGTRTEIKNLNSFRSIERAVAYEIERQAEILLGGGTIVQETRLWDADRGVTRSMRSKEEAHDYRYFPEPDLLPLVIEEELIAQVRCQMPELPDSRRARFVSEYGLPDYDAAVLTASKELADWFEAAVALHRSPKALSNWIMSDVIRIAAEAAGDAEADYTSLPITPAQLAELVSLIDDGTISGKIAKVVFQKMVGTTDAPRAIVEREGLVQVTDEGAIAGIIDRIIAANPDKVAEYRGGKDKLFGFFVGQVMKESGGKANPATVNRILKERLGG